MSQVGQLFHEFFEALTDYSDAVYDASLRLRYQVYCLETGFEDLTNFSDKRERDPFDSHSVHGLIRHRSSGVGLGTVRLVTTRGNEGRSVLPIQQVCPQLFRRHGIDEHILPRYSTGEISRFAVSKEIRGVLASDLDRRELPLVAPSRNRDCSRYGNALGSPLATFGLFLALVRLSAQHGIKHWVALMEPKLLRLLARFGIRFTPIGGLIEHHGWRQPCFGSVNSVLTGIFNERRDLWRLITDNGQNHPRDDRLTARLDPLGIRQRATLRTSALDNCRQGP